MAYKLELPDIGEGVVEAEVQQWFVEVGEVVGEDQPLVEVMTDKATVTIPSPKRGRILKRFWSVGDVAKVHSPLVEMELEGAPAEAVAPAPASAPPAGQPATAVQTGGGATAAAVESIRAERSGPAGAAESRHAPVRAPGQKALATPAVRALARDLAIDLDAVAGSGPGGRVTKEDLRAFRRGTNGHGRPEASEDERPLTLALSPAEAGERGRGPSATPTPPSPSTATGPATPPAISPPTAISPPPARLASPSLSAREAGGEGRGEGGGDERIPLRGVRKRIAENMARSKRTAAHFTFVEQCDVSELVRVKDRIAAAARDEGVKVTFLPFVLKAVVAALRKHPKLNASMDDERNELVLHHRYDLGVASATDAGLVVPVVRGADRRSLVDLAREIDRLAQDAKAGRSRPEDMGRSTFTITSLGALGGVFATPVLNYPEVGILGLHRIRPTPVVREGQVVVRDVMHVSVTSDHRVVDGHEAAAFCYEVIRLLEDPNLLFMHMA